jgi:outer membrane protein OmpA-like peptidoglycan-associated protein/tetratricopeptide (TPR) repeat protein
MKTSLRLIFLTTLVLVLFPVMSVYSQDDESENDGCNVKNKKAEKVYNDGYAEFKSHKYTSAAKYFKDAIDIEPEYVDAYYGLAKVFTFQEKYTTAKKYYLKVAELCPTYDVYVYYYLGQIYLGADNYDSSYYYMNEFVKQVGDLSPEKQKLYKTLDDDYSHADSVVYYTKNMSAIKSKKVPFNPSYVKNVSSVSDEYLPIITPDNELCLFTRKSVVSKTKTVYSDAQYTYAEKFMYSERKDGSFDEGVEMPFPFNENDNEGGATLTIDNTQLFYTVCKYLKDISYLNCDICTSTYSNGSWSDITTVSSKVNNDNTWESQPTVSSDGKTLYFISDRKGGYGGYDIYVTTKLDSGWSVPVNMGPNINSPGNEKSPFIHTDDQTLYFSSTGWPGVGGYDIFYSRKDKSGKFEKPTNIGFPINSVGDDVGFFVSTDGKYGYFASNDTTRFKGPGGWDVYSFELYPEARPDTVLFIKGNVKDEAKDAPTTAKVELKNVKTKQVTQVNVDSTSGKYVIATRFNDDYMLTVKKDDYAYTSKFISKEDTSVTTDPTAVKVDFEVKQIEVGETYRLNDINFAYGSYELTDNSKLIIDGFIEFLNDHPAIKVSIHGHTDNISGADFNLVLSENRAKTVYEYMTANGIDASRLSYKGYGLTMPIATNDTEEGRAKNRRTEFVIIEK